MLAWSLHCAQFICKIVGVSIQHLTAYHCIQVPLPVPASMDHTGIRQQRVGYIGLGKLSIVRGTTALGLRAPKVHNLQAIWVCLWLSVLPDSINW